MAPTLAAQMGALLQPPPLLAMLVVVIIAAAALWFGFGLRSVDDLRRLRGRSRAPEDSGADRPAHGASREALEVWGTPDPLPPARTPFSYDRFVVHESEEMAAPPPVDAETEAPNGERAQSEQMTGRHPETEAEAPVESSSVDERAHLEEPPPSEAHTPPMQEGTKEQGEPPPREISLADIFARTQRPRPPE